jgi:hypothetical protein
MPAVGTLCGCDARAGPRAGVRAPPRALQRLQLRQRAVSQVTSLSRRYNLPLRDAQSASIGLHLARHPFPTPTPPPPHPTPPHPTPPHPTPPRPPHCTAAYLQQYAPSLCMKLMKKIGPARTRALETGRSGYDMAALLKDQGPSGGAS